MTKGWQEWAEHWLGIQNHCERGCKFCFAIKSDMQYKRISKPEERMQPKERKGIKNPDKKYDGLVAFPNTHDITIQNYSECIDYLERLLKAGNQVLIVTKPDVRIIELLISDLRDYKEQLEFRLTITTYENEVIKEFEPNASLFEDRVLCLKMLFMAGFETSVSIEPYTSRDVRGLIERIFHYVTREIWVGIMNHFSGIIKYYPEVEELRSLYTQETVCEIYGELRDTFQHPYYCGRVNVRFKDTFEKLVKKSISKGKCRE